MAWLNAENVKHLLPDTSQQYLLDWFHVTGLAQQTGNGLVPLPWSELKAWCDCTEHPVEPWEMQLLFDMSQQYVSHLHGSTEFNEPPLWADFEANQGYQFARLRRMSAAYRG